MLSGLLIKTGHSPKDKRRLLFSWHDLKADLLARRRGVSTKMFERVDHRGTGRGEVRQEADLTQIHFRRDVEPEQRIVRGGSSQFEKPVLGGSGNAPGILRQFGT